MKILHTADWHLGQTFYEFDRSFEHQEFLYWLVATIQENDIDCLIISGDVFDLSNPSTTSVRMFYTFLSDVVKAQPHLQIIVTAGNHDSASRLESPKPLLESSNIHIIGTIDRDINGSIDFEKLVIPIKNKNSEIDIWCLAIPFLRLGDYPAVPSSNSPYSSGVAELYKQAYEYALTKKKQGQAVIAMGHLHTLDAEVTEHDKHERLIMGGVEFVPVSVFHKDIIYTGLGHIHKAQSFGVKGNVRYSGSPIPMSFAELDYTHRVIVFEVKNEEVINLRDVEIPLTVKLLRVPLSPCQLPEVFLALQQLPDEGENMGIAPFLEVRVLLDGPEPALRHKIETALENKHVRLAKIDVKYHKSDAAQADAVLTYDKLHELDPASVFNRMYKSRFQVDPPDNISTLFIEVVNQINTREDQG